MNNNSKGRRTLTKKEKLLFYWGKVIGLCPFTLDEKSNLRTSPIGSAYSVLLSISYTIFSFKFILLKDCPVATTSVAMIAEVCAAILLFGSTVSTWILLAFKQTSLRQVIRRFKETKEMAMQLNINEENAKMTSKLVTDMIIFNFAYVFFYINHMVLISIQLDKQEDKEIYYIFHLMHVVSHNLVFAFYAALLIVERKFNLLNRQIRKWFEINSENHDNGLSEISKLKLVRQLHDELSEVTEIIEKNFSFPILLSLLSHFGKTASDIYMGYLTVKRNYTWQIFDVWYLFLKIAWINFHIFDIFCICNSAENVSKEANKTVRLLHVLVNPETTYKTMVVHYWDLTFIYHPEDIYLQMKKMSIQLLQKRLKFSIFGVFPLDTNTFCGIVQKIMIYEVFMLQLD